MLRLQIRKRKMISIYSLISLFIIASCATKPKVEIVSPMPPPMPEYVEIKFSNPLIIDPDFRVTDDTDPKQIVLFALKLYQKQNFLKAARFFLEAESLFPDDEGVKDFRLACLNASALSFLEANDMQKFISVMKRVTHLMSPFEDADAPSEVVLLKAISDKMEGKQALLNGRLPYSIEEIFKQTMHKERKR